MEEENNKQGRIKSREKKIIRRISDKRKSAFEKLPLLFTMLSTFGLVATFYGFERLIDKVDILANNPWTLLAVGLITLLFTGTLYSKLS